MAFDQKEYISKYNKSNYKMYQFRVRKEDEYLINYLDNIEKRNSYINNLIYRDIHHSIYTIKEIKQIILPILRKYGIKEVYLFGSYARGEANINSDIDIFCEEGDIESLLVQVEMEEELKEALKKEVDVVFFDSEMNEIFRQQIMEDMIKLC